MLELSAGVWHNEEYESPIRSASRAAGRAAGGVAGGGACCVTYRGARICRWPLCR